ncbi:hypothetical protein H4582DRAFT_2112014 [Lactarius indigo]|nr:hypothetical protein H4582DRAFT_2112014 [Lactarius indigo]
MSIWAPFQSQCDWEIAHWAKMHGPTSSAVVSLLAIPQLVDKLELSYHNTRVLNRISRDLVITGETLQLYYRDIIQCLWALYGDPKFAADMIFAPECHHTKHNWTCRVYSDMHTGDWWWAVQTSLESHRPGATVIPVILSSDKTQLTLFRSKATYPTLIGYIPITKLPGLTNKAAWWHALTNLFHSCMQTILAPITIFVGDYPEQVLVMCTYSGQCPKCTAPHDQLRDFVRFPLCSYDQVTATYSLVDKDVHVFHAGCHGVGLKPVFHPFWESLLLVNIFMSITLDILHQMLQGIMKHLVAWLTHSGIFGTGPIDAHCQSLLPNHLIKTFSNGISTLSRVLGQEHKDMCWILLSLVVDLPLPSGQVACVIRSVYVLLNFLYLVQLPSQTANTVVQLNEALARFHSNKAIFVDLGICEHFNILKFHSLMHYTRLIALFGTMDNYNTEQTERLHIDFTKDAYHTTNHKDEYPQMTTWLECHEKAVLFNDLAGKHGATDFQDALVDFITQMNHPEASAAALRTLAADMLIPFHAVPVFYRIKFTSGSTSAVVNAVHVQPEQIDAHRRSIPPWFDTIIQIAQVCVVFQIPARSIPELLPSLATVLPTHLAYVEWFSPVPV